MSKMTTPQMSVIRFNESDVIVASNGFSQTLMITNLYNTIENDAEFSLGDGSTWTASQISKNAEFLSYINGYLESGFTNLDNIRVVVSRPDRDFDKGLESLAGSDLQRDRHVASADCYNNHLFTWNGSYFYSSQ